MLYSRGFKFGENGQIKIWVHFGLQVSGSWIWPKFLVFSTHNLIGLVPHCKFQACREGPLLKGLQIWRKRADQNLGPFWPPGPQWLNLTKIFSLFNTQLNRTRASPASFKHVGQVLYSRGFKFGEKWDAQNLGPFWPPGPRWLNLTKIFSLFNRQSNRPRTSPASFKHVGQVLYSRGFKFGENGPIKIWVHFGLQVRSGWIWPKFLVFSTHKLIGPGQNFKSFQHTQ